VLRNITITISDEAARWARLRAAEENTSVSKLVGRMLEDQMRRGDDYRRAYQRFTRTKPIAGFDASKRLSRAELYERRR
jgi:transposase